jgi:hypothetical protein
MLQRQVPSQLFHGTRAPIAAIRRDGLQPPDLPAMIQRLAIEHGVCAEDLALQTEATFIRSREGDRGIYLSPKRAQAESYASQGSEAESMLLEAIHAMLYEPEQMYDRRGPQQAWVADQVAHLPALVVTVTVPNGAEIETNQAGAFIVNGRVPPQWIKNIAPVTSCVCSHNESDQWYPPNCDYLCPACRSGNCPYPSQ